MFIKLYSKVHQKTFQSKINYLTMFKINTKLATSAPFSRRSKNCFHDYVYKYMYMKISLLLKWYLCITVNNYNEIAVYALLLFSGVEPFSLPHQFVESQSKKFLKNNRENNTKCQMLLKR